MEISVLKEQLSHKWQELRSQRDRLPLAPDSVWSRELEAELDQAAASLLELQSQELSDERLRLLSLVSGLHLWNGNLDRSHELAQDLDTSEGSYLHGMMHRMEGDFSNANYWFRLAGGHPNSLELQTKAAQLLHGSRVQDESFVRRLKRNDEWDAALFTDLAAASALTGHRSPENSILEELQALELSVLLDGLVDGI